MVAQGAAELAGFLSPPSARRATEAAPGWDVWGNISIPALREEGDATSWPSQAAIPYFYPRPPRGGRRRHGGDAAVVVAISIPALREEGDDGPVGTAVVSDTISIPALREEGDGGGTAWGCLAFYFYPRPPRGGRHPYRPSERGSNEFLSPPSARRATRVDYEMDKVIQFLSPPSARRATVSRSDALT